MFTNVVTPKLSCDAATGVFPNIHGASLHDDTSFVATLRALLHDRIPQDESITLTIYRRSDRVSTIQEYGWEEMLSCYTPTRNSFGVIQVMDFAGTTAANKEAFRVLDNLTQKYPDIIECKDLGVFVAKVGKARFFIDEKSKNSYIFVANLDLQLWHYFQSFISRLTPWHFKDKPLTDDERLLAASLIERDPAKYIDIMERIADRYDFRSAKIKELLSQFETAARRGNLEAVRRSLEENTIQLDHNTTMYQRLILLRDELKIKIAGLEALIAEGGGESEIMDYFICNKALDPVRTSGSRIEFIVSCYLENFDPDMYERIAENRNSYIYTTVSNNPLFRDFDVRKKFLDAIFSEEPILKIKMCAFYGIDLMGEVYSESHYDYPVDYCDRMPNPHLDQHDCLGNHRRYIEQKIMEGDCVYAVEQCVASAKSVNVGESATFPGFLDRLFRNSAGRVIELPDGTSVTPKAAYEWLVQQDNKED